MGDFLVRDAVNTKHIENQSFRRWQTRNHPIQYGLWDALDISRFRFRHIRKVIIVEEGYFQLLLHSQPINRQMYGQAADPSIKRSIPPVLESTDTVKDSDHRIMHQVDSLCRTAGIPRTKCTQPGCILHIQLFHRVFVAFSAACSYFLFSGFRFSFHVGSVSSEQ